MLGLVDPKYLTQKVTKYGEKWEDIQYWRYVFYFGFWNKLIYLTDSLTSLRICYTIGQLGHFKKVYLLNYHPDLPDAQIESLLNVRDKSWFGDSKLKHGYEKEVMDLCLKVMVEESLETLNTDLPQELEFTILLNQMIKEDKIDLNLLFSKAYNKL